MRRRRNASTSSGVGGRPIRSNVRAADQRRAGRPSGEKPGSCLLQLGEQEGVDRRCELRRHRLHAPAAAGWRSGWNDQNARLVVGDVGRAISGSGPGGLRALVDPARGSSRARSASSFFLPPAASRRRRCAGQAGSRRPCRRRSPGRCRRPWPSAAPAAGRGSPSCFSSSPWHWKQCALRIGRTCCSKVSGCSAAALVTSVLVANRSVGTRRHSASRRGPAIMSGAVAGGNHRAGCSDSRRPQPALQPENGRTVGPKLRAVTPPSAWRSETSSIEPYFSSLWPGYESTPSTPAAFSFSASLTPYIAECVGSVSFWPDDRRRLLVRDSRGRSAGRPCVTSSIGEYSLIHGSTFSRLAIKQVELLGPAAALARRSRRRGRRRSRWASTRAAPSDRARSGRR